MEEVLDPINGLENREMCNFIENSIINLLYSCLLYTSDAADE